MTFFHFFTSSFQNLLYCELLWLTSIKKITRQKYTTFLLTEKKKQVYWVIMWLCRSIFLREKIWLISAWLSFTVSFGKGIVKDVVKQALWHADSSNMIFGHLENSG